MVRYTFKVEFDKPIFSSVLSFELIFIVETRHTERQALNKAEYTKLDMFCSKLCVCTILN